MSKELIARAQLLASVEAGITFWSREVFEKGALKVIELCKEGEYKEDTKAILSESNYGLTIVSEGLIRRKMANTWVRSAVRSRSWLFILMVNTK